MKAAIIAAGWGERLGRKIPKALVPVGGRALIDYALDGVEAAGFTHVTCIVNGAAQAVPEYVSKSGRRVAMDWIIQTTPSSMHSFLIVLDRMASHPLPRPGGGEGSGMGAISDQGRFMITAVDSVCPPSVYRDFWRQGAQFDDADVCLGLTRHIEDEKPLRVALRGASGTGIVPDRIEDDPRAFEIVAMTTHGFGSEFATSGFYAVRGGILEEKARPAASSFTALRQYLGHLLKCGYRFYGVPLPAVVDVDRPQDVCSAERLLKA